MDIQYYATIGTDAKINGFYNTDIHTPEQIPADAKEISEEEWQEFISVPHQRNGNAWEPVPPLTPEELVEAERNRPRTEMELLNTQAEVLDERTLGMQAIDDFTLQQQFTIDERTAGMQEIDDYTLQLLLDLQQTVADLTAEVQQLKGGA